jgi:3'-5' exoribonuclease
MKDFFVADAARFENQTVTSFFCLASISLRDRRDGRPYLALTLADKTGQFEARMWEEFADLLQTCREGCYVKVQGLVARYQGRFQITLSRMRSAAESEIEAADFVPTTRFDVPAMDAELRGYVDGFREPHLRALVLSFLDDPAIGPAFRAAPAAKRLHHAWIGGLLEHVLALVRVCRATAPFYPEVDPDLLVTGAILHDIGKVRELSWGSSFNYTLEGQLIGHISIAQRFLEQKIAELDAAAAARAAASAETGASGPESGGQQSGGQQSDRPDEPFPHKLRILIEHMILAHHGKLEFGSPKLPMTPEAMLLSALDDLEAKFETLRAEFRAAREAGRSADDVTEWVRSMERPLFDSQAWLSTAGKVASGPAAAAETEAPESPGPVLVPPVDSPETVD